jgi:hypothetical protein
MKLTLHEFLPDSSWSIMSQAGMDQLVTRNTSDHVLSPILSIKLCEDRHKIKTVGMSGGRFNNKKKYEIQHGRNIELRRKTTTEG